MFHRYHICHCFSFFHLQIFIIFCPFFILSSVALSYFLRLRFLSIHIPKYLYSSVNGIPMKLFVYFSSLFNFIVPLWSMIPHFFRFNFIPLNGAHFWRVLITFLIAGFPLPCIAISSA